MEKLMNLDKLHISARRIVRDFSRETINTYGDHIKSITVYGSVLSNFFNPKKSDINLLLILDSTDLGELKKCIPIIKRYRKRINPLLLTKDYIRSSQDVYPIEFLEMKENYLTIFGEDVLKDVDVDRQYLRLECEQQLKGSLLKLRQGFLRSGLNPGSIERLMKESINSVLTIFRNLIRIKGEEPPVSKEKVFERMANYYNLDKEIFSSILKHKIGFIKINAKESEFYFNKYLKALEMLTEMVDEI